LDNKVFNNIGGMLKLSVYLSNIFRPYLLSFRSIINIKFQSRVLRQTATSRRQCSPTFWEPISSPNSGCCWWL